MSVMCEILFTWIGATDLRAMKEPDQVGLGPVLQAVKDNPWDEVVLLCDYPKSQGNSFYKWLNNSCSARKISFNQVVLSSPTDFSDIYLSVDDLIKQKKVELRKSANFTFHLSPGTPAMAAVWIILSKTKYPSTLIESSRDHGVKTVSFPFEISADFIPTQIGATDERLVQLAAGLPGDSSAFADIIHRSEIMQRVIIKARLAAVRPILLLKG